MAIVGRAKYTRARARNFDASKFRARACVLSPSPKLETTRSLEMFGQKLFSAEVTAQAAFHKLSLGVRYIGVPLHVLQFA